MQWRNFDREPLSREELDELIGTRELSDFLNPRSTPWKKLGLKDQTITRKQAIDLLLEDMNLLKRPLLIRGKSYTFGFKEDAWAEIFD